MISFSINDVLLQTTLNSVGFVDIAAQVNGEKIFYLISFLKWKGINKMEEIGGVIGRKGEGE